MEITVVDNVKLLWTFFMLIFVYGFGLKYEWLNLKSMIILSLAFGFYHTLLGLSVGWGYYDLSIIVSHFILAIFFYRLLKRKKM